MNSNSIDTNTSTPNLETIYYLFRDAFHALCIYISHQVIYIKDLGGCYWTLYYWKSHFLELYSLYNKYIGNTIATIILIISIVYYWSIQPKHISPEDIKQELEACRNDLINEIKLLNCNPILLRLAWSDVQSYDKSLPWPQCGGSNGNIRFEENLIHSVNTGLDKALDILRPIKDKYKLVSWADLIQMAGALSVELANGPIIEMKYGRIDCHEISINESSYSSRCPYANQPYPNYATTAEVHLRNVFYRMGFSNREIVALMGAHTIGRGFKERSGICKFYSGDQGATPFTRLTSLAKVS